MQKFWNLVISGAVTGAIYSIMASGLVLTYQTSGIFNFAHGAVAFSTAFFYYQLHSGQGIAIVPSAILSILVFAPLLGLALDRLLLRRLATAPVYARIVGTIGLLVALPAFMLWIVEAVGITVLGLDLPKVSDTASLGGAAPGLGPQPPEVFHPFSGINLDSDQLAVFIAGLFAAFILWFVIRRTRVGLQMRAVVDRESLASLRGVNPGRTSAVAWVLTMVLAGLGGVLIAPLFQLNDTLFTLVVLGSLAAVAVSGLRSIPIAFAGGLVLGILQNLVAGYGDDILPRFVNELSGFRSAIPFILTLLILVFVGRERGRAAGSVADDAPALDHRTGLPAWRRRLPWAVFTVALLAFTLQWIDVGWLQADAYEQSLIALGIAMGLVFLSFVVVTGLGGMVSLAQATFVTTGGFAAGWALNRDWGIDFPFVASHGQINFALGSTHRGAGCGRARRDRRDPGASIGPRCARARYVRARVRRRSDRVRLRADREGHARLGGPCPEPRRAGAQQRRRLDRPGTAGRDRPLPAAAAGDPLPRAVRAAGARAAQPPALRERAGDARGPEHGGRGADVGHLPVAVQALRVRALGGDRRLRRRPDRDGELLGRTFHRATAGRPRLAGGRGDVRCPSPGWRAACRTLVHVLGHDLHLDRR